MAPIVEVLSTAFVAILRAVESEQGEKARIARAKREILALSSRVTSDALLRRMLDRGKL